MLFSGRTLRFDLPAMVVATLLFFLLARDGSLGPLDGALLLTGAVAYTVLIFRTSRREDVTAEADTGGSGGPVVQLLVIAASIVLVVVGAELLVDGAVQGAPAFGVDEAVIGLTVVAIVRGESGLAVGNLVRSSVYNIALVLGVTVLAAPGASIDVPPDVVDADLVLLAVGTAIATPTGARLTRFEGGVLVATYLTYLVWLILTRT